MNNIEKRVAEQLLSIKAVTLNAEHPFTWASGWKAPIYCDNRKILSYPDGRRVIVEALANVIKERFGSVEVIAGVATSAIAWGALVAEQLNKPFVYVRPRAKDHGTHKQIEGEIAKNQKIVVIEDLISTGRSSLSAATALAHSGAIVMGMVAIFSYNLVAALRAFENSEVELHSLCHYESLLEEAVAENYIKESDLEVLKEWRLSPSTWMGIKEK